MDIFVADYSRRKFSIERLTEIDDHYDPGLDGDPEQRDVSDPNGNAEIVAQEILQKQTASHGTEARKDQDGSLCRRLEEHVKQDKDQGEYDRQDVRKALASPQLEFIFARPFKGITRRQMQLPVQCLLGTTYIPTVIIG